MSRRQVVAQAQDASNDVAGNSYKAAKNITNKQYLWIIRGNKSEDNTARKYPAKHKEMYISFVNALKVCLFIYRKTIEMSKVSINWTLWYFDFIFWYNSKESCSCRFLLNIQTPTQIRISHVDLILSLKGNLTVDFIFPSKHFQHFHISYISLRVSSLVILFFALICFNLYLHEKWLRNYQSIY